MNRGQMRDKLRRRVQDEVGDSAGGWTDAELDAELNDAYAWVQKEIFKVLPEAHLFWDTMDLTAGTSWYPLPATFGVSEIGVRSEAGGAYAQLGRKMYADIKEITSGTYYAQRGQWIGIFPAPPASIVAGIQIVHTPIMAMSADTDLPRIKVPLHEAIVLKAKDAILGDLEQEGPANRMRLADMINDIPQWYEATTDMPDRFSPRGL